MFGGNLIEKLALAIFFLVTGLLIGALGQELYHQNSINQDQLTTDYLAIENAENLQEQSKSILFDGILAAKEKISPHDRVNEGQIHVLNDKIIIDVPNAQWSTFSNTNSMDPVIDIGANALQIVPKNESDIQLGDIISYEYKNSIIIHRVIKIGQDENGWYAITKGDNNPQPDPKKVRFESVRRVLIGIIY
ncbi:signal peptidase I [Candidatus Woesearchaeota archaeon]|nr:signal peptidase I [Candidatus Woesearchaeota archaeon]